MISQKFRMIFSGLAAAPVLTVALASIHGDMRAFLSGSVAMTGVASVAATIRWRPLRPGRRNFISLGNPGPLRSTPRDLPSPNRQREVLARALSPAEDGPVDDRPVSREEAVSWILHRSLSAWHSGHTDSALTDLPAPRLLTLYLLARLLTSSPGEAGEIAQHFRRPDAVLSMRDEVDNLARIRAEWDRDQRIWMATHWLWTRQAQDTPSASLAEALEQLGPPDIDLWHRVVTEHDPDNPDQAAAAFWCLRQPACDRATVAAYLARIVLDGRLVAAARKGDTQVLTEVRGIIDRWNAGVYKTGDLGIDPPQTVTDAAPRLPDTLRDLEQATGDRWPAPAGAFTRRDGRPPRPRPAWDLATGQLTTEPQREDYLDAPAALLPVQNPF